MVALTLIEYKLIFKGSFVFTIKLDPIIENIPLVSVVPSLFYISNAIIQLGSDELQPLKSASTI